MVAEGRDEEFFGHVEFSLLDNLVETSGRLLDRWVSSGEFVYKGGSGLSAVGNREKTKTQFFHRYFCPGIPRGQHIKPAPPPEGSPFQPPWSPGGR